MSSIQRRRGQPAKIWKTSTFTDRRGNITKRAVEDGPYDVIAAFLPQRSSRAEVPGQQVIEVYTMIVAPDYPDVELWSRVTWNGSDWDMVSPPEYHHGTRHTRHWSIGLRKRPTLPTGA